MPYDPDTRHYMALEYGQGCELCWAIGIVIAAAAVIAACVRWAV